VNYSKIYDKFPFSIDLNLHLPDFSSEDADALTLAVVFWNDEHQSKSGPSESRSAVLLASYSYL
jgi:hypothetical protein